MEVVTSALSVLVSELWGLASKPLGYIYNLKDYVDSLKIKTQRLKAVNEDVKARVEHEEEEADAQRTKQVAIWLGKVQEFVGRVDQVLREAGERNRIKCLHRFLPRNCWSSYKLGKRVDRLLNEARQLLHKIGEFNVLTLPSGFSIVGLDISLNKVLRWLVDKNQVRVIGLHGRGGVGKTTLMKMINDELSRTNHGFDIVIWVVVSKRVNVDKIQDVIRKRLHIQDEIWDQWSQDERVHHLFGDLIRKKFVLLIDDVWRRLDLSKIGVPPPSLENGSKVVFTTRLKHVCDQMGADKIFDVHCLAPEEALELFENIVGESTIQFHPKIPELAKDIVQECKGLPLALITVGRAMAGKMEPYEWMHALTRLRNNPYKLSGMVEEVYHILEFSYNSLNDSTLQLCFLYCCLFPENYPIITDELIELWIGEGLLGGTDEVYRMRDKGESILGDLKRACLLESGLNSYGQQYVKMHDVIRDMASWIACDRGQRENKLLVIETTEDMSAEMISKWGDAEKVSLWGGWIQNIDRTPPRCSQLKTLFVRKTYVRFMPRGFFDSMTVRLTVLDLSENRNIKLFPEGICNLINLRYLNLSATGISELPKEIKNLTRLLWLLLDDTTASFVIPTGAIASLPLNVFSQWKLNQFSEVIHDFSGYYMDARPSQANEKDIIEELGRMQHLTNLSITVSKSSSALKIFQSPNLQSGIRRAWIIDSQKDLTRIVIRYSQTDSGRFLHLEELYLQSCDVLREMEITQGIGQAPIYSCFPRLVIIWIERCGLLNLSWLGHAPNLRELTVTKCNLMKKVIGDGFAVEELGTSGLFSRLETLKISYLPSLTSICDQTLPFPRLVILSISRCPRLRKLLLASSSAQQRLQMINADADWWAKLEWDDDGDRKYFNTKFISRPDPPPIENTTQIDIPQLYEVWKWLVDEKQVGVIGLYGIGGVGKTTLIKRINKELSCANHGFDVVIWVVVSRQVNEYSIQDAVRKSLNIKDELWEGWSWDERVHHLWEDLTRKKFVLLIDDLWGRLDLSKIGVPRPSLENGSKVVFTTRLKQVCDQMEADKTFEVQCLTPEEALGLFENIVDKSTVHSHPEIPRLAKDIVRECKGLPLTLVTVGQVMAGMTNPHQWKHVLTTLRNSPHKLLGMVEECYRILELSYVSLNDSTLQHCFLYCCLFPEDYPIRTHKLIELWIGEGLLGDTNDVYSLRDKGECVLQNLKMACLLESQIDLNGEHVKMHSVIRNMATWIARDRGQRENKLLVIDNEEDISVEMVSKWGEAEKVSLWGRWNGNMKTPPPGCSQLKTLFVRETKVTCLPRGFFDSMTARLTVLDLSCNEHIQLFPKGICNLISLQYLNLSGTRIRELPREIKNLTRLQWLLLDDTAVHFLIPIGAIASLPLIMFSLWKWIPNWSVIVPNVGFAADMKLGQVKEKEIIEELGCMQHLTDLSINMFESSSALKIFQSPNLRKSIRRARIIDLKMDLTGIEISYSPTDGGVFSHLEELYLQSCPVLKSMEIAQGIERVLNCSCFPSLVIVWVESCGLSNLSWLVHAPKLRELTVVNCDSTEKIIGDGFAQEELLASGLFSHLETLQISNLPTLTSICDQTLPFPRLEQLYIVACPGLRKLSLHSNCAWGSLRSVHADTDWWSRLEWDDDATRAIFTAMLRTLSGYFTFPSFD